MITGISILFSKPKEPETNLFSFTQPLSFHVWIYTATAYLGLSIVLYILARFVKCTRAKTNVFLFFDRRLKRDRYYCRRGCIFSLLFSRQNYAQRVAKSSPLFFGSRRTRELVVVDQLSVVFAGFHIMPGK